jgi:Zn-finger nucleic acid-binding protein
MKCPKCGGECEGKILGVTIYDRCKKCGGLWFDKNELYQIRHEKDWFKIDTAVPGAHISTEKGDFKCPRCREKLQTIKYEHQTSIKIDVCPKCEGIFLDAGELDEIHKASETWVERLKEKAEEDLTAIELFTSKITPYLPRLGI